MKKARYIVIEGADGIGKSTQVSKLSNYLRNKGYKVLETKEPGTPHIPATVELRKFVLDAQYADIMTPLSRELITQTIRSIHMEKLIIPAIEECDFIVQDRGVLSGICYAAALGHDIDWLEEISIKVNKPYLAKYTKGANTLEGLYDDIILLKGNTQNTLERAINCKKEYEAGDFIESQGTSFQEKISSYMEELSCYFGNQYVSIIDTDNNDIDEVFSKVINKLNI